jgi:O-antigen/teichoic acid export membrane protein
MVGIPGIAGARTSLNKRLERPAVRNFAHMFVGNGVTTALQAAYFVIVARILGPFEFGKIAATSAVSMVLLPFAGAGFANILVMRSSRNPAVTGICFGNALFVTAVTSVLLTLLATMVIVPLLGTASSVWLMSLLCLSEMFCAKQIETCGYVFVAKERFSVTSRFMVLQSAARVLAVCLFAVVNKPLAFDWACWALASNFAVALYATRVALREVSGIGIDLALIRRELRNGLYFSVGISAKGFYTDADKAFLGRFASLEVVGMYASGFRVVQMALTPMRALASSSQAKFFQAGERGLAHSLRLAAKLALPLGLFSVLAAIGFLAAASSLPVLFGPAYASSVDVVRALCLLPLVLGAQTLVSDALTGAGHQGVRAAIQVIAALTACALNLVLIPTLGWKGAVIASYGSQMLLFVGLLGAAWFLSRERRRL